MTDIFGETGQITGPVDGSRQGVSQVKVGGDVIWTAADTEPPTTPGQPTASNVTETSVDLSWSASSDNEGVAGYYVHQDGTQIQDVSGTSTTVSGLSQDTQYSFAVSAYDDAGNESSQSPSTQVTTEISTPSQAIHHYPMNEESGITLADVVGSADITVAGPGLSYDSRYTGGVAPSFDGEDDYAQGQPDLSTPFTVIIRVYTDGLGTSSPNYRTVICDADDNNNSLLYDVGNNVWRVNTPRVDIADSDPTGEHILALRSDSNQTSLRLYDSSGSLIDSNSVSGPMDFSGQVNLGRWTDATRLWDGTLDNLTVCDGYLNATEINNIVNEYY